MQSFKPTYKDIDEIELPPTPDQLMSEADEFAQESKS